MKVLVAGIGKQDDIKNAFETIADVIYWDWTKQQRWFDNSMQYLVDENKPDLIFLQIQTPGVISEATAKYISSKSIVINWTGDVRAPLPQWYYNIGKHIRLSLFTNMNDVESLRTAGIKSEYLQIGFPDKIFTPDGPVKPGAPEIIFFGNNIGGFPLSGCRAEMVKRLKLSYGNRFGYYGINWGKGISSITNQHEEASYYRGAKIAINLSHFNYSRYSSDRLLRAIGAGCFTLSHNYTDYDKEFKDGLHFGVWSDFEELHAKIDHYLVHDTARKIIAETGCKEVHKNHSWKNRITQLMEML